jgi:glycosyltransferase involved in cell wall biosynthesis
LLAKKKNLPTLIRGLHLLKDRGSDYPALVIAGRRYHQSEEGDIFRQVRSLDLESDVYYIGPVEDEDLPGLYGGAQAFVFPSLHEGFGIPCLEAMTCRVPVVAARSGAIPEVVGDAALLVDDPTDADLLADAIQRILTDPALREEMIARGLERARQFSWPRFAEQVLTLYREVLRA